MEAFAKFQNDFDNMSDNDVIEETRRMEDQLAEAEDWLEAVAAWDAAGRPRGTNNPTTASSVGTERSGVNQEDRSS